MCFDRDGAIDYQAKQGLLHGDSLVGISSARAVPRISQAFWPGRQGAGLSSALRPARCPKAAAARGGSIGAAVWAVVAAAWRHPLTDAVLFPILALKALI